MTGTAIVYTYKKKPLLQRIWSWLTVTAFTKVKAVVQHIAVNLSAQEKVVVQHIKESLFTITIAVVQHIVLPLFAIAKAVVKYISNFIVEHKVVFMVLNFMMTVIEEVYPPITTVVAKGVRLLLPTILLQKNGTFISSMVKWLQGGRLDFQSLMDELVTNSRERAQTKLLYSFVISGSCFSIWLGATIAERQIMELAIFAGIALMIALRRSISLFLLTILIGNSVTPFLWIRKARCTPNDPLNSVFDLTLLIATTCCCMINTPFANKIITSFSNRNQLQPHQLFALKQGLKGTISIVLVWACGFSPLILVKSLFLTLGVYELFEMIYSDEASLLIQEGFIEFWRIDSPTPTLSEIVKGLSKIIAKLEPYVNGQDAPSKNELLCVSLIRILLSAGLALTVSSKCGKMVFTGLCLFSFCISRMEDFHIFGSVFCRKPVLDTLPKRLLFCFSVIPSTKKE